MFDEIIVADDFVSSYLDIICDLPMPNMELAARNMARIIKRDLKIYALEEACKKFVRMHHMGVSSDPFYSCNCQGCEAYRRAMKMKVDS